MSSRTTAPCASNSEPGAGVAYRPHFRRVLPMSITRKDMHPSHRSRNPELFVRNILRHVPFKTGESPQQYRRTATQFQTNLQSNQGDIPMDTRGDMGPKSVSQVPCWAPDPAFPPEKS